MLDALDGRTLFYGSYGTTDVAFMYDGFHGSTHLSRTSCIARTSEDAKSNENSAKKKSDRYRANGKDGVIESERRGQSDREKAALIRKTIGLNMLMHRANDELVKPHAAHGIERINPYVINRIRKSNLYNIIVV